ncbi:MAG: hypothetical protein ACKVS8_01585 [Phycisphaerales bacterium]
MKRSSRTFMGVFGVGAVAALAQSAAGQLHESDVLLRVSNARVQTGAVDPATQSTAFPQRVFVAAFGPGGSVAEPGFEAEPFALPDNATVGFDFASAVRVWDGSDFDQIASPFIRARFGPLQACSPGVDAASAGFGVAVEDGLYHHHFTFTLAGTCEPLTVSGASGVYLLTLTMWCDAPGVAPSEPLYLILGRDAAEGDVDAARVYVQGLIPPACVVEYNGDGVLNPDDIGDFITDYFTDPPIAGPGGYAIACAGNAPPYAAGYKAAFTVDGSGQCNEPFPDNLGDYITAYFAGC